MKFAPSLKLSVLLICLLALPRALVAQALRLTRDLPSLATDQPPAPNTADLAWKSLLTAKDAAAQPQGKLLAGTVVQGQIAAQLATQSLAVADQARAFYLANPTHSSAPEARDVEILSLVSVAADGDQTVLTRLDRAVSDLRAATAIDAKVRARGVAAYEFTKATRQVTTQSARMVAVEKVAQNLIAEFPSEPQGYEALLALAKATEANKSGQIARQLLASNAPDEIKRSAQTLVYRYALVGSNLSSVIGNAGSETARGLSKGTPVIVYSWASWAPGSVELGQMIQARRFAAIGICLDTEIDQAKALEQAAGLGGVQVYDPAGGGGAVANQLKYSAAGQIYLVDAKGVIRDVRGGDDLETKLKTFGFKTPLLVRP